MSSGADAELSWPSHASVHWTLHAHGVLCWRQTQGAISGENNGKRRFLRFTSMAGVSDILGVLPPTGRLLAVETKRSGRKPTPEQSAFLDIVGLSTTLYDPRLENG